MVPYMKLTVQEVVATSLVKFTVIVGDFQGYHMRPPERA